VRGSIALDDAPYPAGARVVGVSLDASIQITGAFELMNGWLPGAQSAVPPRRTWLTLPLVVPWMRVSPSSSIGQYALLCISEAHSFHGCLAWPRRSTCPFDPGPNATSGGAVVPRSDKRFAWVVRYQPETPSPGVEDE